MKKVDIPLFRYLACQMIIPVKIPILLLSWGFLIAGCGGSGVKETPEIVTVYACSSYCPGPDNIYQKRVYRGIVDPRQCRQLDGEPYTYGLKTVCVVQ